MMAFAGADRMQDGMRRSFGKPADRAARVKANQELLTVRVEPRHVKEAMFSIRKAISKLPTPAKVRIGKGLELVKNQI